MFTWNSRENYYFLYVTLKLLGWKHHQTGIEEGFTKGTAKVWFCDDGSIEFTDDKT